jgi:hypothetical protein
VLLVLDVLVLVVLVLDVLVELVLVLVEVVVPVVVVVLELLLVLAVVEVVVDADSHNRPADVPMFRIEDDSLPFQTDPVFRFRPCGPLIILFQTISNPLSCSRATR